MMANRQEFYRITLLDNTTTIAIFEGGYGDTIINILESVEGLGDASREYETTPRLLGTGNYIVSSRMPEKTVSMTVVMPNDDATHTILEAIKTLILAGDTCSLKLETFNNSTISSTKLYNGHLTTLTTPINFTRDLTRVTITFLVPTGTDTNGEV